MQCEPFLFNKVKRVVQSETGFHGYTLTKLLQDKFLFQAVRVYQHNKQYLCRLVACKQCTLIALLINTIPAGTKKMTKFYIKRSQQFLKICKQECAYNQGFMRNSILITIYMCKASVTPKFILYIFNISKEN